MPWRVTFSSDQHYSKYNSQLWEIFAFEVSHMFLVTSDDKLVINTVRVFLAKLLWLYGATVISSENTASWEALYDCSNLRDRFTSYRVSVALLVHLICKVMMWKNSLLECYWSLQIIPFQTPLSEQVINKKTYLHIFTLLRRYTTRVAKINHLTHSLSWVHHTSCVNGPQTNKQSAIAAARLWRWRTTCTCLTCTFTDVYTGTSTITFFCN